MSIAATVLLLGVLPVSFILDLLSRWLAPKIGDVMPGLVLAMLFGGIAAVMIGGGPLRPIYIDKSYAKFRGASEKFLSLLPRGG